MSFVDTRFPERWALDAVRAIRWQNEIGATRNQRERRNTPFATARYSWDLSMAAHMSSQRAQFDNWFLAMWGQEHTFPFRDPADYTLAAQTIALGTGALKTFQIIKSHTIGATTYDRNITTPVTATVQVWINGALQSSGWTVSRTTGIITFASAPAEDAVIAAACQFDVPVRFNQDSLEWAIADKNTANGYIWTCPGLKLLEVVGE